MKCGPNEQKIEFYDDNIILTVGNCTKKIPIKKVKEIYYNKDFKSNEYYFRVADNSFDEINFAVKYDIKYKCLDVKKLVNSIENSTIPLIPDIGQISYKYNNQKNGILNYCKKHNSYLLSIIAIECNLACIYYGNFDSNNYMIEKIDNLNINDLLTMPKKFFPPAKKNRIKSNLFAYIIGKELTFGRGYCLITIKNFSILTEKFSIDDVFYSFNESEIKRKINLFLETYSSKIETVEIS